MTIDKKVYGFIEHELYNYNKYKLELELERERILSSSGGLLSGMPRGTGISDTTMYKAIKLTESTCILHMERTIRAIEAAIERLPELHQKLFQQYYLRNRGDKYALCNDLAISYETFKRYKRKIILSVGAELGVIRGE